MEPPNPTIPNMRRRKLTVATFLDHLQAHVAGESAARAARANFAARASELQSLQDQLKREIAEAEAAARAAHPSHDADALIAFAQENEEVFEGRATIAVIGGKMTRKASRRVEIAEDTDEDEACLALIARGFEEAVKTVRSVRKDAVGIGKLVLPDIAAECGIETNDYVSCTIKIG